MRLVGAVTASREASLRLHLRGLENQEEEVEAVIDTGFNGYLTLSTEAVLRLSLQTEAQTRATLADGTEVSLDMVYIQVQWGEEFRTITALVAEGDPLIGMSLLYGCNLSIDVVDGGQVSIKPLPEDEV